ncbi:MAG TPA: MFS transporter [Steroidobacteraceae bacterium]|nr:MFS transporter [Steroidobacteraceae bacterium]
MGDHLAEPVSDIRSAGPAPPARRPGPAACIYAARALRDFGDGFAAVLLPVYLAALGLGAFEVGVVSTAALLGSSLITLAIGSFAPPAGQRILLLGASALMFATGLAFAASESYSAILAIAFVGTLNPTAGNVSIFVPMEHALLAGVAPAAKRTRMFAVYGLVGALAAAVGALVAGSPDALVAIGWTELAALRVMFLLYAVLGLAGGAMCRLIPVATAPADERPRFALGPSKKIVYRLAALFSVDAFAGGFAVQSLMALWLFQKFGMSLATAGMFFFWSGLLAAFSYPAAAWLAARIGLVNTMVWTHIPSSLCLIGAALAPDLRVALGLLLARSALSQMDVPARSSYVMAVVTPPERAAAASVTSVPRGLASAASPALAGALFAAGWMAWPFIICGMLKIGYDLALLWGFRHVRPPEER